MYALNCTVTIVAGDLNITWFNSSGTELTEGDGISFSLITIFDTVQRYDLIFNSLDYSDIGVYTCKASFTVGNNGVLFNGNGSANTTVSVISTLKLLKYIASCICSCSTFTTSIYFS